MESEKSPPALSLPPLDGGSSKRDVPHGQSGDQDDPSDEKPGVASRLRACWTGGWESTFACFLLQVLISGTENTFGEFLMPLMAEFDSTETTTSLICSVMEGFMFGIGIVTAPLLGIFGWRMVSVIGTSLCILSYVSSSFAPNIYILYITYGVLLGSGLGLLHFVSFMYVQRRFSKHRAMATGIVTAGIGAGILICSPLVGLVIDEYGWRNTMRMQATLMVLGYLSAILMCPSGELEGETLKSAQDEKAALKSEFFDSSYGTTDQKHASELSSYLCGSELEKKPPKKLDLTLFLDPTFIFLTLAATAFCFGNLVPYIFTPERATLLFGEKTNESGSDEDVDPLFSQGNPGVLWDLPDKKQKPADEVSAILLTVIGVSIIAASCVFGIIGERSSQVRFVLCTVAMFIQGLASFLMPYFNTEQLFLVYCVVFGTTTGAVWTTYAVVLVDLLGVDVIERALGQSLAFAAIGYVTGVPLGGLLEELTKNINNPFSMAGLVQMIGTACLIFTQVTIRYCKPCCSSDKSA